MGVKSFMVLKLSSYWGHERPPDHIIIIRSCYTDFDESIETNLTSSESYGSSGNLLGVLF